MANNNVSAVHGVFTMQLVDVTTPVAYASRMPRLTDGDIP
jgi:hypothetical protein